MEHEIIKIEREIADLKEAKGRFEASFKTVFERLGDLSKLVDTVYSIAQSTEILATNQGTIQKDVQGLKRDLDDIKTRPIKHWKSIAEKVVLTAVGILVGWLLKQFGIF